MRGLNKIKLKAEVTGGAKWTEYVDFISTDFSTIIHVAFILNKSERSVTTL